MKKIGMLILTFLLLACISPVLTMPAVRTANPQPSAETTASLTPTETQTRPTPTPTPTQLPGPTLPTLPPLAPGQRVLLSSLTMMDQNTGWGIDTTGHIFHISVGGNIWQEVTPPQGFFKV